MKCCKEVSHAARLRLKSVIKFVALLLNAESTRAHLKGIHPYSCARPQTATYQLAIIYMGQSGP